MFAACSSSFAGALSPDRNLVSAWFLWGEGDARLACRVSLEICAGHRCVIRLVTGCLASRAAGRCLAHPIHLAEFGAQGAPASRIALPVDHLDVETGLLPGLRQPVVAVDADRVAGRVDQGAGPGRDRQAAGVRGADFQGVALP